MFLLKAKMLNMHYLILCKQAENCTNKGIEYHCAKILRFFFPMFSFKYSLSLISVSQGNIDLKIYKKRCAIKKKILMKDAKLLVDHRHLHVQYEPEIIQII